MTPGELLQDLRSRGVELAADGDRLRFRSPGTVPAELLEALRTHKAELLGLLTPGRADGEFRRFTRVAEPWPDGRGWFDPGLRYTEHGRVMLAYLRNDRSLLTTKAEGGTLPL